MLGEVRNGKGTVRTELNGDQEADNEVRNEFLNSKTGRALYGDEE